MLLMFLVLQICASLWCASTVVHLWPTSLQESDNAARDSAVWTTIKSYKYVGPGKDQSKALCFAEEGCQLSHPHGNMEIDNQKNGEFHERLRPLVLISPQGPFDIL